MKSTLSSFECGLLELNKGNLDLAESLFRISLLTDGDTPDCLTNLGIVLKQKGLLDDSQSFYEHSLTISPDNVATLYNLGLLYFAKSENALAELTYERAYAIDPENIDVVIQLCRLYTYSYKYESARTIVKLALASNPSHLGLLHAYSSMLLENSEFISALSIINQYESLANELSPDILFNLLLVQLHYANYSDAEVTASRILVLDPSHIPVRHYQTILMLLNKRFLEGWRLYENRNVRRPHWSLHKPIFIPGIHDNVLVTAEQGIGDEILYASVLQDLSDDVSSIILQCDTRLHSLYSRSFPSNITFISPDFTLADTQYDSTIRLGSLPSFYRNDIESFKASSLGYLVSDTSISQAFRAQIKACYPSSLIVGISWMSSLNRRINIANSMPLFSILESLQGQDIVFVNLQHGSVQDEIISATQQCPFPFLTDNTIDLFNDIDKLSSLITACDQVITTPNLIVSLSGSLSQSTHFLLPKGGDRWRWGISDDVSYWFNSVKIYRQHEVGDWSLPLKAMSGALRNA